MRGRLAALEREAGLLVQLDGLVALAGLLVETGRRLVLARLGVAGGSAALETGAHVHRAGGGEAVAGLVGGGGLGQLPDRLEQLRRAQIVLALLEEGGGLGGPALFPRHLAAEVGGPDAVAGAVVGLGGSARVLGAHEQLGGRREAPELHAGLGGLGEVLPLGVDLERLVELPGLLVELPRLARRLLLPRAPRRRIGRGVGDVLHEVLLVALRRLQRVARLVERLGGAQRVAALQVEIGGLVPQARHAEQARGVEGVALLEEERGGLGVLARVRKDLGRLLVVAALDVELGRSLDVAQALEVDGRRVVLLALEVDLHRLRKALGLLEHAAGREIAASLLEALDLLLELGLRVAGAQHLPQHRVRVHRRPAHADARDEFLVYEEGGQGHQEPLRVWVRE